MRRWYRRARATGECTGIPRQSVQPDRPRSRRRLQRQRPRSDSDQVLVRKERRSISAQISPVIPNVHIALKEDTSTSNPMLTISCMCQVRFPCQVAAHDRWRILRVPFTASVKLRALLLKAGPGDRTPTKVSLVRKAADHARVETDAGP